MNLVSENLGTEIFGVLLVTFFVGTFVLARSLSAIMSTWDRMVSTIVKKLHPKPKIDADELSDEGVDDPRGIIKENATMQWPLVHARGRKNNSRVNATNRGGRDKATWG